MFSISIFISILLEQKIETILIDIFECSESEKNQTPYQNVYRSCFPYYPQEQDHH
jgi:hypothetical protein